MDKYLKNRANGYVEKIQKEADRLREWTNEQISLINGALSGENDGYLFTPFDEDGISVLFVGDTVYTKYGDELVVTGINKESGEFSYDGGKMGVHRITGIKGRG